MSDIAKTWNNWSNVLSFVSTVDEVAQAQWHIPWAFGPVNSTPRRIRGLQGSQGCRFYKQVLLWASADSQPIEKPSARNKFAEPPSGSRQEKVRKKFHKGLICEFLPS